MTLDPARQTDSRARRCSRPGPGPRPDPGATTFAPGAGVTRAALIATAGTMAILACAPPVVHAPDAPPPDAPTPAGAPATSPDWVPDDARLVIVDGQAQVVEAYADSTQWIRERLWVETAIDSDGDGRLDRVHVSVARPRQTETDGIRVPVIYETSPYYAGTASVGEILWDVRQELYTEPPPRGPQPHIPHQGDRGDRIANSHVATWVPRGFAVVHSEGPGTGMSRGCPTMGGINESLAPKAVVQWLTGQARGFTTPDGDEEVFADWSAGRVGMTGTSFNGTLPLAAASTAVEGLEAIIPIAPNTSYWHYYRSHGLVRSPGGYLGEDIDSLYDFVYSGPEDRREYCNTVVREGELLANLDRVTGNWNDFWASRDYVLQLDSLRAAVLMAHAWNDWNVMPEHSVRVIERINELGTPLQMYFHQGGHGGAPPAEMMNRWFTRYVLGVENGVEQDARAWIVREGGDRLDPTAYADWPVPGSAPVTLRPGAGGEGVGALGLDRDVAAAGSAGSGRPVRETFVDDVAFTGAELARHEHSPNRLLYATPELTAPLHVSGTPEVTIRLALDRVAANLSVWVVALPWEEVGSREINFSVITRGWADPQNHRSLTESVPMVPGEFRDLTFTLQPTDQVIPAGKRIGLMIFSSDREFTLWPSPGTELTVELDGTSLTLPVVGGAQGLRRSLAAQRADPPGFERHDCDAPLAALDAVCGTYPVFEDRAAAAGRTIGLRVVVIPARSDAPATEAVTFLAGGPGSAATDGAPFMVQLYGSLLAERDFLFVDQRGTAGSNPLDCELYDDADPRTALGDFFPPAAIRACRTQLEERADLRLYTTAIAADDLDEVRAAFGYDTLTLHGISYGTRAALVYMRRHPDRVRAAVLEGAAPPDAFMPLAFARDAQRALDGVLAACEADAACATAFPTVREDARRAFAGLEAGPAEVRVLEPDRGDVIQVALSRDLAAEAVRYMLYSAGMAAFIPVALNRAAAGDYAALAEFALFARTTIVAGGSNGMYLSVTCAEDLPWIPEGAGETAAEGTFLRDYRLRQQRTACELWPRGDVPADFADPVRVDVPTLILSGEWDPVTPPAQGDLVADRLPASRHIVIPDGGHGSAGLVNASCVHGIVAAFMARASTEDLDTDCLATVRRGPFATENPAPAPVAMDDAALDALTGEYEAIGVPMRATVTAASGRLRFQLPDGQHIVLVAADGDRFRPVGMFGAAVEFEREDGELRMTLFEGGEPELMLRRR